MGKSWKRLRNARRTGVATAPWIKNDLLVKERAESIKSAKEKDIKEQEVAPLEEKPVVAPKVIVEPPAQKPKKTPKKEPKKTPKKDAKKESKGLFGKYKSKNKTKKGK